MWQVAHDLPPGMRELNRAIPRDLETIVHKAMAKEPEARYQSAEELANDLERFIDARPIHARRIRLFERCWLWCRRNPHLALVSLAAIAFWLLTLVASVVSYHLLGL